MKKCVKIFSLLLAILMLATALPITAMAARSETYIKELRISTASTADAAKKWLTDNGYTVINTDLNQKSGNDCVYLGYKTTTNPDEAITDLALMQEEGGYSFSEYEALLERRINEINNMLDALSTCLAEARANLSAGKTNAIGARDVLNFFREDDSGMLLGDFLLGQQTSREDMTKIFLQSNGDISTIIHNMLAFACTDNGEDTSWLAKLKSVDVYGDYDPRVYNDAADAMFESFVNIHDMMVTYESEYLGIAEKFANDPEYADYTDEEIQDLLPDSYAEYTVIYETLCQYQYGGKPLLDFFMKDPDEIDTDEFFPILSTLSKGQQEIVKFIGFASLIAFAQSNEETAKEFIEAIKGSCALFSMTNDSVSVYYGVDRSLFSDGGIALTNASLRKSASTGDNSWFSGDNIDPTLSASLHIAAGSCAALAIGAAVGAKFASNAAKATYEMVLKTTTANLPDILARMELSVHNTASRLAAQWSHSTVPIVSGEMYETAVQQVIRQRSSEIALKTSGDYCEIMAKEASKKMTRLGVTLNVVAGVAMGAMLVAEGLNLIIRVVNYYNKDYTEIPRVIVDEVITDTDSYFVNYYAVKAQNDASADLNAWDADRWNALYTTTDKKAGDPIVASSLIVKLNDSNFPSDEHGAVHYFGETAAANVNRYQFRRSATPIYIFYERDHSLSMTGSTFSGGQMVMFTGFGLIGGVVLGSLGAVGAGKMKKKNDNLD